MMTTRGFRQRSRTGERGAAMVEMAIVLPVLLLLVFGIIDFGRLYNTQVTLTHAAQEGIRDYAIFQDEPQAKTVATAQPPHLITPSAPIVMMPSPRKGMLLSNG